MKKYKKICTLTLFILSFLIGDQASPSPFTIYQPNGDSLEIYIRGGHLQSWHEYNGQSITEDENNWWVYAKDKNKDGLVPSQFRIGQSENPYAELNIRPLRIDLPDSSPIPNLNQTRSDTFNIPWVLVQFPDASSSYTPSELELLLDQPGYSHPNFDNTGSFHDFYKEISYGQFLSKSKVSNWITAPNSHDYYGHNNGYDRVRELVRNAVDQLEESGFDWSIYDNDGDGYVDALNIIHQGPGAEEGVESNIWSHKWSLGNLSVSYDNVIISSYTINPEIQGGNIVAIGVLAHEFGHALGLPDLYDTDYSSTGSGKLALMAGGSWGTTGNTPWYPSTMNAWCKAQLGWVEIEEIEVSQTNITLTNSFLDNKVIRINHPAVTEEYWLIENRQKIGSDTLMPTAGLAIWHINDDIASEWNVNGNEPYYGVGLEQADGQFALENGGPSNGADIYPGSTDNREFSHSSTPNTTSLYGLPSLVKIDEISDSEETMSFNVTYSEIIIAEASIGNGSGNAYSSGSIILSLDNDMPLTEFEFELEFSPAFVTITGATPFGRASYDSLIIIGNHVTLVNPIISEGDGEILEIQLFNNVGVSTQINVKYAMAQAYTDDEKEVGITFQNEASYQINSVDQYYTIQTSNGQIGGGASYQVNSINTVPISLSVIKLEHMPILLTPADEPYEDLNGNNNYDLGEPFNDLNQNQEWTPMVESSLPDGWSLDVSYNGSTLTVGVSNWIEATPIGTNNLFKVNCIVNDEANLNDLVTVSTDVILQVDKWGNNGVPFVNGTGTILIDGTLSNDNSKILSEKFTLNNIYPNPFNNSTLIDFELGEGYQDKIQITFFDIRGRIVETADNSTLKVGRNSLIWNATNLSNGIYFMEFKADGKRTINKLTLLK